MITCDMSLGFKAGISKHLRNATTVIDKFHVIKHANEAVDIVTEYSATRVPPIRKKIPLVRKRVPP